METFSTIVSIFSGASVIVAFILTLVRPIREKITRVKERDQQIQDRFDGLKADIDSIGDKVTVIDEKVDRNEAQRARTQILRFADELYEGRLHTKEHFDEILDACDLYNHYCDTHPKFKNQRTVSAQKHINRIYEKCVEKHKFLDTKEDE